MRTICKVTTHGYGLVIEANGGESELVIGYSCGQDGRTRVSLMTIDVDGGCSSKNLTVKTEDLLVTLYKRLLDWMVGGKCLNYKDAGANGDVAKKTLAECPCLRSISNNCY